MYEQIARFYDLVHAGLTADIAYVLSLAGRVPGPVLELGCGTGRLLLPLARAGHQVTGVDNSPAMLALARQRLSAEPEPVRNRVSLVEVDMTRFSLPDTFGLALVGYNTLMHLSPDRAALALQRVRPRLAPDGHLLLDLANPFAVAQTPEDRFLTLERCQVVPDTGEMLVLSASSWVVLSAQVLHLTWLYDTSPAAGGPLHRTAVTTTYHYYFPHELELLLATAGLSLEALYGGYEQQPFTEDSARLLVLAQPGG